MTLKLGLDPKLMAQAVRALEPFARAFQDSDAFTLLIIGELRTGARDQKVIEGKETVKPRLITVHPVTGTAAHHVRRAARAAWFARNMRGDVHEGGNLFVDGQAVDLDPQAVEQLAGQWAWEEFARLRIGVAYWLEALQKLGALNPDQTSPIRYHDDLKVIIAGIEAALGGAEGPSAPDAPEYHALTQGVEDLGGPSDAQVAEQLIVDAEIVCGAVLTVAGPGDGQLGFIVTCQRDEHDYGDGADAHAGIGEDGELWTWPNVAPPTVPDEPQAGGRGE